MRKIHIILIFLCISISAAFAQTKYSGIVCDENEKPLAGVKFFGPNQAISMGVSNADGKIELQLPENGGQITFVTADNKSGFVTISKDNFKVVVTENDQVYNLGRNMNTTFKTSTHSLSQVQASDLDVSNEVDPTKALFGQLAGLIVMQKQGFNSSPSLNIRGNASFGNQTPLVLVDGFPRDLSSLSLHEVESVTVLKDAAATALYGNRGANGVIVVTTKRGSTGKLAVHASYKYGMNTIVNQPEFVDAHDYAVLYNEALQNDGLPARFSQPEIEAFKSGTYTDAYPNVDWQDEVYRDQGTNHQLDLSFTGGGEKFRYFSAITYSNQQGLLKPTHEMDEYQSQLGLLHLNLRTNIDVDLTETTLVKVGLLARLQEYNRPFSSESNIYKSIYSVPAGAFPVKTNEDIFGSNNIYKYNPVAMVGSTGFKKNIERTLMADLRLVQDLGAITDGLFAEAAISFDNMGTYYEYGSRTYEYQVVLPTMEDDGTISDLTSETFGTDSQLSYGSSLSSLYMNNVVEGKIGYLNQFGEHGISGSVIYQQENSINKGRNSSRKRQSILATASYNYKGKYFADAVVNYTGSDVMPDGERFTVYPALSAAWLLSEEDFLSSSDNINLLKVRGSFGFSGNDLFAHDLYRQVYKGDGGYRFTQNNVNVGANKEQVLAVEELLYEKSMKADIGIDFAAFDNRFTATIDGFYDKRTNMLVNASPVISSVIGVDLPQICTGELSNKGVEITAGWNDKVNDFEYSVSGNFAFVRNEILENNEGYKPYDYLKKIGESYGNQHGLEAIGFFKDENEIAASPTQVFSEVKPGDIKYKDQNNDGIINEFDEVNLGYGSLPEIYYGLNLHLAYKNFGLNAQFQGVANRSIYTNTRSVFVPFVDNANITTYYTEENVRWTPQTAATASLPRLTTEENANNYQKNSLWMKNGAYLKLRNVELYYNIPKSKLKAVNAKIFVRGSNLFSIDELEYIDPEAYGVGYPNTKSYLVGMNINF